MTIMTHGSDVSLAPAVRPLIKEAQQPLSVVVDRLSQAGFRGVQLDAALTGLRPRDLDHRARKDLLALLTRRDLRLTGLDLFIPRNHYLDPQHLDRAVWATLAAIRLAADLGRVPLNLALPVDSIDPSVAAALVEAADAHNIQLAVHAEDQIRKLIDWIDDLGLRAAGAAIDPGAFFAQGVDPVTVVHRLGKRLTVARLSDARQANTNAPGEGVVRCPVGEGDLDIPSYRIAVDLASSRCGQIVLDLNALPSPLAAAVRAKARWDDAAINM